MTVNLHSKFEKKLRNGRYEVDPAHIQAVSNGPDAFKVCEAIAHRYAYQLSFMRDLYEVDPEVTTMYGRVRVHSRVTVRDRGLRFDDRDNKAAFRRKAWRSRVREFMSTTPPTMPGNITW